MKTNQVWTLALGLLAACGASPAEDADEARLEAPCTVEDPAGSSPMGLAQPGKAQKFAVWPNGRIPYQIDSSLDAPSKTSVLAAMNDWQTKSQDRVRFEPAKTNESPRLVVVGGASPITNHVGYAAGANSKITLAKSSSVSLVRHELGHVLGLHHEQRHPEREKYIKVNMQNVKNTTDCLNQFKVCASCVPVPEYNVGSVMHYDTDDLDSCRTGPVLLHLDGSPISHKWVLTPGDIAVIHVLYGAPPGGTGGAGGIGGGGGAGGTGAAGVGGAGAGGASGSAGAGGAIDAGSGGSAGGALGGSAGVDDVIDTPDMPGSAATGSGASGGDSGGCSIGSSSSSSAGWLLALALALAVSRRGRASAARW